jgi:hypothetical protein
LVICSTLELLPELSAPSTYRDVKAMIVRESFWHDTGSGTLG